MISQTTTKANVQQGRPTALQERNKNYSFGRENTKNTLVRGDDQLRLREHKVNHGGGEWTLVVSNAINAPAVPTHMHLGSRKKTRHLDYKGGDRLRNTKGKTRNECREDEAGGVDPQKETRGVGQFAGITSRSILWVGERTPGTKHLSNRESGRISRPESNKEEIDTSRIK